MALGNRVNVRKVKRKDGKPWLATYIQGGAVRKNYFRIRREAEAFQLEKEEELRKHGTDSAITAAERSAIVDSRAELKGMKLTARKAIALGIEYARATEKSCTVAELKAKLLEHKKREKLSARHLADLERCLGRFVQSFGELNAAVVTPDQITDWLLGLQVQASTMNRYRALLVTLFTFGVDYDFCRSNPAKKAVKPKTGSKPIGILKPAEAGAVLGACCSIILPYVALGLFTGARDAELKRMVWSDVDLEQGFVTITPDKNQKSPSRRLIPIRPALAAWLAPYALAEGEIFLKGRGQRLLHMARLRAGFGTQAIADKHKVKVGTLKPWPHNAARHSYASYTIAEEQNAAKLALEMGHDDATMIFTNYRELVLPADAAAFWALRPPKGHENIIQLQA